MTSKSKRSIFDRIIRPQDWEAIKIYSNVPKATEATIELEKRVMEALIRYLIRFRMEPEKITLRGVERGLGLSYSKVRRLLKKLVDKEIVISWPVGKQVAFLVADLERAIREGYLSFDKEELRFLSILLSVGELEEQIGSTILALPKVLTFPHIYVKGLNILTESWIASLEASKYLLEMKKGTLSLKIPSPLKNLIKRYKEFEEFERFIGQVPLTVIPIYRSIVVPGMKDLISGIRRELGIKGNLKVKLRYLHPMAYGILMRELFFELDCKENPSDEEVKTAMKRLSEKQLKLLLHIERPLLEKIKQGNLPENLSVEAVLYEAIVLRLAAVFALNLGANDELVREAREAAELLESTAEEMRRRVGRKRQ